MRRVENICENSAAPSPPILHEPPKKFTPDIPFTLPSAPKVMNTGPHPSSEAAGHFASPWFFRKVGVQEVPASRLSKPVAASAAEVFEAAAGHWADWVPVSQFVQPAHARTAIDIAQFNIFINFLF